jgi:hypothetical protein
LELEAFLTWRVAVAAVSRRFGIAAGTATQRRGYNAAIAKFIRSDMTRAAHC